MDVTKNPYQKVQGTLEEEDRRDFVQPTSPPQYSAMQQQQPHQPESSMSVNVMTAPMLPQFVNMNPAVGPTSTELTCPQCRCRIKTKIRHRSTAKTHLACLLLLWTLVCCCIPYCMNSCRNANHFCPMCGCFIGTYQS